MKELGFKDICFGYYNNHPARSNNPRGLVIGKEIYGVFQDHNEETEGDDLVCSAPTYSQCFRWFREKHNLDSFCRQQTKSGDSYWKINILDGNKYGIKGYSNFTKTYEEAETECLKKLIELCQNQI